MAGKSSPVQTDVTAFTFNERKSSAWVSDKFSGTHSRQIKNDILAFTAGQIAKEGGLDVGLASASKLSWRVRDVPKDLTFCSTYDIELIGKGRWWAGPKISVNWQGIESAKGNGDDWYENYIIEIASSSPQELHDMFTDDYFKAEILEDTIIAGSTYNHYKIRFHDWWQFWSVRQDYRETGTVPIQPILDVWIANGLPTHRKFDGVKANIETYGEISGTGLVRMDVSTRRDAKLDCAIKAAP